MELCEEREEREEIKTTTTFPLFNLEKIKTKIESMGKQHHIEILKILKNHANVRLNENKSGVFINLSFLQNDVLDEIVKYIDFIGVQEDSIRYLENQREEYKNTFFVEDEPATDNSVMLYNN